LPTPTHIPSAAVHRRRRAHVMASLDASTLEGLLATYGSIHAVVDALLDDLDARYPVTHSEKD
jgi:hypothetical protein